EVVDSAGRIRAHGTYSPGSQIVARLWTFDERLPGPELFLERFEAARRLREKVVPARTTGFRAINSEGDLCPGILLDIYGEVAVLDLLTEGIENREDEVASAIRSVFQPSRLEIRRTGADRDRGSSSSQSKIQNPKSKIDPVPFLENGLRFFADVGAGQK